MNTKNNFSFPVLEHPAPQCDTNEAHELASEWTEISEDTTITPIMPIMMSQHTSLLTSMYQN